MLPIAKRDILNRLKTVRGHVDGILRMTEEEAYCVDLMKQVSAAQASLERVNRLKTVRGHVDGILRMTEEEAYCVDLMKQVSAAQASLERVNRLILKNHLETCFSEAVNEGRAQPAIAELLDAVKFNAVLTGADAALRDSATGEQPLDSAPTKKAAAG